nr:MAG TPA: crystallin beta/gamma motif-containing protein [Caudoviricetes sp.]
MDEYNAAPNQDPIEEIQNTKEQEDSLRRLNEAFAGIAPFGVNEDLRTAPTGDAKPHTPQKGILEKIGDGISGAAESVSNAAKSWADNRLQNMSMDIYSNLYDPDPDKEKRLEQAHKIGDPLGLPAQMLVDSKEAYEMAQNQYAWMKTQEIMQGRPFSANALKELYPELAEIAMNDPVSASLALKQADQILHDRGVITGATAGKISGEPSSIGEAFKAFTDAWEAGQNMDKISEIGYAARNGDITDEEMNRKIEAINARTKEYDGDSTIGLIATETVKQFSMMGAGMLRSLPEGAAAGLAVTSVLGAPVVGGIMAATIFASSLRSNMGMNYYRLANKKNADGTNMYSRNEAKGMATREAVLQAGVETGLMSLAYGALGKVIGESAAKAAIMNAGTRNKLLSASRGAMRKYALKEAAKQYAKGTAAEIAEEGWQDLISTADEKMMGRDKNVTWKNMWNSAFDAMVEAIPAAVGMGMPGAVISGGGNYAGLKRLTKEDWHAAREAFYRENEKEMTQTVIKEREQNKVFKIDPEVYAQKTQAQLDKEGMGTIYIDAAGAAETEEGRTALTQLVTGGIATAEQVDNAVKEGTQLELKAGIYMQKISEESAETLSNHAAFDKDGQTLHDIEEARKHIEKTRQIFNATKEAREAEVAKTILDRDFTDPEQKIAMEKIFAEGMDDIKENYKKVKAETLKTYEELINYKYYADYEPQGVEKVPVYEWSRDYEHGGVITSGYIGGSYIRTTNNDRWYANAWKKYGRKPNKRELYDIAEQEAINEIDSTSAFSEEEKQGYINSIQAARKEVETIESLEDYVKELDTRDLAARTLLSQKAYDDVYVPTLEQLKKAPAKVAEAAEESAFVYARLVDNFSKIYNLPIENIVASIQNGGEKKGLHQNVISAEEKLEEDTKKFSEKIDLFMENKLKGGNVKVMTTPLVMKLAGAEILPIYVHQNVLSKILKHTEDKTGKHGHADEMTPELMKQLPSAIADPMAIVENEGKPVVVTTLVDRNGDTIIIPFTLNKKVGARIYYDANIIESVYGKRDSVWIKSRLLTSAKYINKKRTNDWLQSAGLQSPIEATISFSSKNNIPNESDLVKLKEQNQEYYQTINKDADIFFHGAVDPVEGDVIKEGYFHGMFYSSSRNSALGHGDRIYISEVNEDDIISAKSLAYEDGVYAIFEKKYGDDAELLYDLTTESRNIWDLNEEEKQKVYELLGCTDEADADFMIQKEAALVADELGYKAVAVEDEHGTSYIILPGNKVYEESTYEKLNPDYNYRVYHQKAYHGSPYTFDHFDLGAIGTGEGNQAHGWGLYFAQDKKIAENYKDILGANSGEVITGKTKYKINEDGNWYDENTGNIIEDINPLSMALTEVLETGNGNKAVEGLQKFIKSKEGKTAQAVISQVKRAKEAIRLLKENGFFGHEQKTAFEVEIPEDNEMLDEFKNINKQPRKVQTAIRKAWREIGYNPSALHYMSGREFYKQLASELGGEKAASEKLNSLGVKGITYDGLVDGKCFVVFDDKAIQIINRYNQEHKGSYAGAYDADQNILHVFEAANQSTVVHESAHWWLSMLNNIAADPELKELAKEDKVLEATLQKAQKDRDAIRAWASYYPDVMKEYKGTLIEKEFKEYEAAIKKNPENKELQERFIQERFARGFERYLLTGKAPTKELQGTFRRFKKWLINLYKTTKEIIKNPENYLGLKDPSDEVKEIFDHMVASEEEIEAWAEEKRWNLLYDDSLDYTQTEKENIKKWEENIKELAKENAVKYFMEKLHGQAMVDFEENILPEKVETFERKLGSQRIYGLEMLKKGNVFPTKKEWIRALKEEGFTEESYKDAVQEAGGTMEEQVENYKKKQREEFIENISGKDHFRVEAEKVLESPEGKVKLAEIEQNAMKRKLRQYARIATASLIELDRLDPNMEGKISKKILYDIKKRNGFLSEEEKLKEEKAEQKKAKQATVEEINELKIKLRNTVDGLRTSQDSMIISPYELKAQARAFLYGKEIYKATNYRWWARKAASEGEKAAYFLKRGRWEEAARAKGRQSRFAMNAQVAHEYDDHVKHTLHGNPKASTNTLDKDGMEKYGLVGLINRASKATNNIRMPGNIRYFINHLAYQLGLITTDGRAPLGMDGEPAPFDWANLNNELDPTAAMEGDKPGDAVPQWIKKIFDDNNQTNLRELTVIDFDELVEVFKKIYKTGRREYEGNTFVNEKGESLSFEEAEDIIMAEIKAEKENPLYKKLTEKKWKKTKKEVGKWVADLALPEIIIERMGPQTYDLIYKMMDKAFAKKRLLQEQAKLELKKVMDIYDRETFRKIRNDKIYEINKVDHKPVMVTKETLLTMALNWGTDSNRERVVETYGLDHRNIEKILFKYLNDKDWDFVEAVWKHINSYWPERNIVQNNLYGIPLGKVPGRKIILPDGRKINGMYYPIKYDADLTSKTKDREINDIIRKDMLGRTTFNIGMGSTKSRAQSSGGQYLRQDLDVYLDYINESINHIAMRETTADIYKLLSRKDLAEAISQKYGVDAHRRLQRWASDCWHDPVDKLTAWEQRLNRLRHNFTMATMAYRTSTALLNFANLPLVMEKMGAVNMARGLSAIYLGGVKNYRQQRDFILSKSTFMRDRATNMDRDLARGLKLKEEQDISKLTSKAHAVKEEIDRFAYSLISETDFMLSLPEWIQTYNNTIAQLQIEKPFMTVSEMDEESVRLADKMVRETFGSGEMKDRPEVVKSRLLSQLLPFYSFTSLVMNQFIRGGYDIVDGRGPLKLMRAMIFWYILGSVFEGALRSLVDSATGNDKYSFLQRQGYSFASNGPIGGIPVAREVIPGLYSLFAGMYSDGGKMSVTGLNIFEDVFQTAMAIKSDKKDWIDVGQAGTKVFNKVTGLSDTLTDALWAIARLTTTDTDATAWEALFSIIFDRRIKKKGEKK